MKLKAEILEDTNLIKVITYNILLLWNIKKQLKKLSI